MFIILRGDTDETGYIKLVSGDQYVTLSEELEVL